MTVRGANNEELNDFESWMDKDGEDYLGPTLYSELENIYNSLDDAITELKENHAEELSDANDALAEKQQRIEDLESEIESMKQDWDELGLNEVPHIYNIGGE